MITAIIERLRDEATGDEREGVWEEGYLDALHDVEGAIAESTSGVPLLEDEDGAPYPGEVQAAHVLIASWDRTPEHADQILRALVAEDLPAAAVLPVAPCPTCSGSRRETVGMVCQSCGTDYVEVERLRALCDDDLRRHRVGGAAVDSLTAERDAALASERYALDTVSVAVRVRIADLATIRTLRTEVASLRRQNLALDAQLDHMTRVNQALDAGITTTSTQERA